MSWLSGRKKYPGWLALQMHDDYVEVVHVRRGTNGQPEVALCDSFRKEESDVSTLSRLRKELKLNKYRCTTLLSAQHYQLHEVDAPGVPLAEMKAAVHWRMKDLIDYPLESATVDVLRIPGDADAPDRPAAVYGVTARTSAVEACIAPFAAARIALEAVDIRELAQRNIAALFEAEDRGIAMLAFYPGEGMLTFTRRGELYAARRIEITVADLLRDDAQQRDELFGRIALEVQRSLDHFERQYHYVPLAKLLLAPLPRQVGLEEFLASSIDGVVESADLTATIDFPGAPELGAAARQCEYLSTIGAALRAEEGVAA
jgi:MSHA biogenesis protein MshI